MNPGGCVFLSGFSILKSAGVLYQIKYGFVQIHRKHSLKAFILFCWQETKNPLTVPSKGLSAGKIVNLRIYNGAKKLF
ncbi:MAG: hypothetical protein DI539_01625 [Flavobacterium psychrophilum]|nr:MAG: hypothetical protein DI539_01625 [Flavobacterium psychrophilum]